MSSHPGLGTEVEELEANMSRGIVRRRNLMGVRWSALLITVVATTATKAGAQSILPDAQVEANVLKALARAPDLANESITTRTVYGTVTLSGSVSGEPARSKAETLAANANGVKKVVDELQLNGGGDAGTPATEVARDAQREGDGAAPLLLQSDGTYAPAPEASAAGPQSLGNLTPGSAPAAQAERNDPDKDQALDQSLNSQAAGQNGSGQSANPQTSYPPDSRYPSRRPMYQPGSPGYGSYAGPQGGFSQPVPGGQAAGEAVTIPSGALVRIRINRTLSSNKSQPGTVFDGTVVNDVVANGFVAIPRGASVQGTVLDSKSSGALKGRGEMSIQLTRLTLGGKTYPLVSDVWAHHGGDKTVETINKTAGFGALGAVVGALAGGGPGAAIGGGVGVAAGLGSSAASGNGQVFIPAESIVTFHTAQPTEVTTVSEQEMQRLAYGAGPSSGERPPVRRVYRVYPGYYPPPGYYPYPPYGYPNY